MRFLVEMSLKVPPTNEILALLPAEMARGVELDQLGVRERLYVAADNSRAWQIFHAESPAAAEEIVSSFPMAPYSAITITPLADQS
jgi:muconolactone delta-isomerase